MDEPPRKNPTTCQQSLPCTESGQSDAAQNLWLRQACINWRSPSNKHREEVGIEPTGLSNHAEASPGGSGVLQKSGVTTDEFLFNVFQITALKHAIVFASDIMAKPTLSQEAPQVKVDQSADPSSTKSSIRNSGWWNFRLLANGRQD